jgi:hypothetical protein
VGDFKIVMKNKVQELQHNCIGEEKINSREMNEEENVMKGFKVYF